MKKIKLLHQANKKFKDQYLESITPVEGVNQERMYQIEKCELVRASGSVPLNGAVRVMAGAVALGFVHGAARLMAAALVAAIGWSPRGGAVGPCRLWGMLAA